MLCNACLDNPIIIELSQPLDQKYLDGKRAFSQGNKLITEVFF